MNHLDRAQLEAGIDRVRAAPDADGALELIVTRPAVEERALLDAGTLDRELGLVGDGWSARPTAGGSPNPDAQVTLMGSRAAALVSGGDGHERWAPAGDQLYVDLDLSHANLPAGARWGSARRSSR
jgi:hypothetical protein